MNERKMLEQSFKRPRNYFDLPATVRWEIDKALGILDWEGEGMDAKDRLRYRNHYGSKLINHKTTTLIEKRKGILDTISLFQCSECMNYQITLGEFPNFCCFCGYEFRTKINLEGKTIHGM